jgi:predicted alpha/beta-fold hydrolase
LIVFFSSPPPLHNHTLEFLSGESEPASRLKKKMASTRGFFSPTEVDAAALASASQVVSMAGAATGQKLSAAAAAEAAQPLPASTSSPQTSVPVASTSLSPSLPFGIPNPVPQLWTDLSSYMWSLVDPSTYTATKSTTRPVVRVHENSADQLMPTSSFKRGNGTIWQCETNNKFLMLMCSDIIARRVPTPNQNPRNWRWGVLFSLTELVVYSMLTERAVLPRNMTPVERHEHVVVNMPDGGVSCFHAYYPRHVLPTTPLLLLFPSLTANQSFYSFTIQYVLERYGWIVVVMNRRGLCERLQTPVFHIMGNDEDVTHMCLRIEQMPRLRKRRILGMGLSMGGNVLTRYVGRYASSATSPFPPHMAHRICAGATICSPLNLSDIQVQTPLIEDVLIGGLKRVYLDPYATLFANYSPFTARVYKQLYQCRSLIELTFLHIKLLCPACITGKECERHRTIVVQGEVDPVCEAAKVAAFHARLRDSTSDPALAHETDYTSQALWSSYATFDAARHTRAVEIPFIAITTGDDPIVSHSLPTQRQLLRSRHMIRMHTAAGSHCVLRDNVMQTNSCLSWGEQLALCFLHDNLELYAHAEHGKTTTTSP